MPHHVTQRGNRRQQTFFNEGDYGAYLELMAEWCREEGVAIWSYCLTPNRTLLVAVPSWPAPDSRTGRTDVIPSSFRGASTGVYARYRLQPVVGPAFMPGGPRLQICLFVWTASLSSPFTGILASMDGHSKEARQRA